MNLRELEYLVAVADHGHFGQAAAACFVSQPTLSTQLRKLEHELGVQLVERGARSSLLTPVGQEVVARARVILDEVSTIHELAARAADPRTGRLRLGMFPTLAPYLLPHVLPAVREALPDARLQLVEEKTAELVARLRGGTLDAIVVADPVVGPGIVNEPLFREEFVLATPAGHALAADDAAWPPRDRAAGMEAGSVIGPGTVTVADLAGEHLMLLEEGHCLRDQALAVCASAGADEADGFRATSLETLRHMVATGAGVTLLPLLSVLPPVPANDAVALRRFADPAPARDLVLAYRAGTTDAAVMAELAAALRAVPRA